MAEDRTAAADAALLELLHLLGARGYRFVSPTPATHARVIARPDRREARTLEDVLGWSLPYRAGVLDGAIERLLDRAGQIAPAGELRRSRVRVSSLHDRLFLHSAFPTDDADAVFFGPDSYRFADLIARELSANPPHPGAHIVDIGTGSGVGGIVAAGGCPGARVTLTDVNPAALRFAAINARAAGITVDLIEGDSLAGIARPVDLAVANPPYIIDESRRLYRDGGGMHGGDVSLAMARMAMERLGPGGTLILYTGSAIIGGGDPLRLALEAAARTHDCTMRYAELDPDMFGEELDSPAYRDVERIAIVAAIMTRLDI